MNKCGQGGGICSFVKIHKWQVPKEHKLFQVSFDNCVQIYAKFFLSVVMKGTLKCSVAVWPGLHLSGCLVELVVITITFYVIIILFSQNICLVFLRS